MSDLEDTSADSDDDSALNIGRGRGILFLFNNDKNHAEIFKFSYMK